MQKSIWSQIKIQDSPDRIWQNLSETMLRSPRNVENNIWQILNNNPGGYWQTLEDETLLLRPNVKTDIWQEANDETLILHPSKAIWDQIKEKPQEAQPVKNIWDDINDETIILNNKSRNIWDTTSNARDFNHEKPQRQLGWALKKLETVKGETYYILKNLRLDKYLRINERQVFLWDLMDGEHSIQDIAIAYFSKYQVLPIQSLLDFLSQLEDNGFLKHEKKNIFSQTSEALGQQTFIHMFNQFITKLRRATLSIKNVDGLITKIYKNGCFLLFKWPVQIAVLITTMTGLFSFFVITRQRDYSLIKNMNGNIPLGIIGLYLAFIISIFLHELSHALTCKHYGRKVHQAGIMLYLGLPAFFVDTTDIWMERRKARILVSFAGPYSGLFLAAVSSIIIYTSPGLTINGLLYQFAFSSILLTLTNLNPLIMLDGYYILMDWLEMPMLRHRAIGFVTVKLWKKIKSRKTFDREERIFTIFGLLSLLYTGIIVLSILKLYGNRIKTITSSIFGPSISSPFFYAFWVFISIIILWPYFYRFSKKK